MTPEEMEHRIKRLEFAILTLAEQGQRQGVYFDLGICVNNAAHPIPVPHWMPAPQINWDTDILHLPGEYNEYNYPEDFKTGHDETCCMNGVPPNSGPHPDCPGYVELRRNRR